MKKELDNLTKDVLRARKLGYSSYGMYKAEHPHTKDYTDDVHSKDAKPCAYCMKTFYPSRKGVLYCCEKCKSSASYRRKKIARFA